MTPSLNYNYKWIKIINGVKLQQTERLGYVIGTADIELLNFEIESMFSTLTRTVNWTLFT